MEESFGLNGPGSACKTDGAATRRDPPIEIKLRADYGRAFEDKEKSKKALDIALDTRKFEISLYWQRAAYFWALIAAAFAGYFAK
jgi:hypothetical protein